jgi:hypothetical protein
MAMLILSVGRRALVHPELRVVTRYIGFLNQRRW